MGARSRAIATFCSGLGLLAAGVMVDDARPFFLGLTLLFTLVPSALDFAAKRWVLEGARCERRFDRTKLFAGERLRAEVKLRSARFPFDCFEVDFSYPEAFEPSDGVKRFIIPRRELSLTHIFTCPRRGSYTLEGVRARVRDRFDHYGEELELTGQEAITVFPTYEDVRKMEASGKTRHLERLYGLHRAKQIGLGSEFHAIRHYVPSDEWRRIAWKHFARYLKLMSKEFQGERRLAVLLCLDCGRSMGEGRELTKLEYGVRAAMVFAKAADERGDSYGMVTFAEGVRDFLSFGRGKKQFNRLLELLARAEARGSTSFRSLADHLCTSLRRTALVVLISDLEADPEDIRLGVQKLCSRRNRVLVICPFSPLFELKSFGDEVLDELASAVVERFRARLEGLRRELRKLGVDCLEVGPRELLPLALERHLERRKLGVALV